MNNDGRSRHWLWIIVAAGLALRLGWCLTRPADDASLDQLPDQREYMEVARNLRGGLGLSFIDPRLGDRVVAYRTPGYPCFLAAFGADIRVARIAQAILDAGTVLATYLLARKWLSVRRALFAAAIVALNPYLIYFSGLILTETLFTALLVWGMFLLLSRGLVTWLAGGAILALSLMVRPGALALPVLIAVFAELQNLPAVDASRLRWRLPAGATVLLMTLIVLALWGYRNYRAVGDWVWTSTNAGFTSYDGFNPDANGSSNQDFVARMPQLRSMGEVGRSEYLAEHARAFARENPGRAIQLAGMKIARTWSPIPLSADFSRPAYVAVGLAYEVPLDLLVILGLAVSVMPRRARLLLILPAVYLTVAAAMSVGSLRYRVPAEVAMAVIAAGVGIGATRITDPARTEETLDGAREIPVT